MSTIRSITTTRETGNHTLSPPSSVWAVTEEDTHIFTSGRRGIQKYGNNVGMLVAPENPVSGWHQQSWTGPRVVLAHQWVLAQWSTLCLLNAATPRVGLKMSLSSTPAFSSSRPDDMLEGNWPGTPEGRGPRNMQRVPPLPAQGQEQGKQKKERVYSSLETSHALLKI